MAGTSFPEFLLQWGHDEGVVEGSEIARKSLPKITLQWGHDEGVVEGLLAPAEKIIASRLQWGHDEGVVEGDYPVHGHYHVELASMGPRRRRRGR